eukprot:m.867086 g.867086  ORF g.867086 m.867086 type:complete len:434 (-) comp23554_c2_seq1:48-1349(-)
MYFAIVRKLSTSVVPTMKSFTHGCVVLTALAVVDTASAYNNGRGMRPPMGWNSWCTDSICNAFGDDPCTEKLVKSVADSIIDQGMDKLGYNYVALDDCWSAKTRDAHGRLQADPSKFPNGLAEVATYVHSKNLSFGVYTCVGTKTCKGDRPGSYNNWTIDAETLAGWGVDLVKMDHCSAPHGIPDRELYGNMSAALNHTGRSILFSLCQWGNQEVYEWGADVAQMYRIQMDHLPLWHFPGDSAGAGVGQGVVDIIEYMATLVPSKWIKQYGWLDPDFLMTMYPITMDFTKSRTEFTFWSMWSAPLLVSTDIRHMSNDMHTILMNPEVIAIDQDSLNTAADRVRGAMGGPQVWVRDLANGDKAVVLFNSASNTSATINVTWAELNCTEKSYHVRDLWERQDVGEHVGGIGVADIAPRDVRLYRLSAPTLFSDFH